MTMKSIWAAGACAALLMVSGAASAADQEDTAPRAGFLAELDLDYGGDDLVTVEFEDGESQNVKAGQGITGAIGMWFRPVPSTPFELQGLVGFKYTTTAADNADINVSRVVLELNGVYRFTNDWYVSLGLTHHASPELDGDGFFEDIPFDDSTGFTAEVGWKWIGLHFTNLEYSSEFYEDVDAGSIGLSFTYHLGNPFGW
jgi:hypothetical protein